MATIKSFTSVEQSRKLAGILPLESADMEYLLEHWVDGKTGHHKEGYCEVPVVKVDDNSPLQQITHPCWSLATLLNYLRDIDFFPDINVDKDNVTMSIDYFNDEEGTLLAPMHNITIKAKTFIDACYKMIIILHELKIL